MAYREPVGQHDRDVVHGTQMGGQPGLGPHERTSCSAVAGSGRLRVGQCSLQHRFILLSVGILTSVPMPIWCPPGLDPVVE
jgi:hypothetical protein